MSLETSNNATNILYRKIFDKVKMIQKSNYSRESNLE